MRPPDPRTVALAGLASGLALAATSLGARSTPAAALFATTALSAAAIASRQRPARTALAGGAALAVGLLLGGMRIDAIDGAALRLPTGRPAALTGFVSGPVRRSTAGTRAVLQTTRGRIAVAAKDGRSLATGRHVEVRGVPSPPPPWLQTSLRRQGVRLLLEASAVRRLPGRRPGPAGLLDAVRERALITLGTGLPRREASLLRGFVLGADEDVPPVTREDFNRSGLAHVLAVSGQNVALLATLAIPFLALAGLGLRARLVAIIALIALYVPVAGAGPSIQRAGVMGAAAAAALLAGRPASRMHFLLLAAAATLALNPLAIGDVGWQLSFAAVAGIALWAAPLRDVALRSLGPGALRRAAAEGSALTVSATVATAPLMAHHFGTVSLTSLPANLVALPAVAPAMWLGMLAAAVGQLPGLPVAVLTLPAGACAAFIAGVAGTFAAPSWAQAEVGLSGAGPLAAASAALVAGMHLLLRRARRVHPPGDGRAAPIAIALAGLCAAGAIVFAVRTSEPASPVPGRDLARIEVLDIGQGDAILLRPRGAPPVLVDGGPPGGAALAALRARRISRLGLVVVTHSDSDHIGGVRELVGAVRIDSIALGRPDAALQAQARSAGVPVSWISEGDRVRAGDLRLETLWPPPREPGAPLKEGAEQNAEGVVLLAQVARFRMLLTADAEEEATPLDPGPIDVLKVAHHGSRDLGLPTLLNEAAPKEAIISVGEGNPFGHPTGQALGALAAAGVPIHRTDREGTVVVDVMRRGYRIGS